MASDVFGHYQLLGPLGSGGMGEVFEARDSRLGRTAALKLISADALASPEARARFLREARVTAALSHPNIVTIYEVDAVPTPVGERLFIAMERVQGETLADRLSRGRPDLRQALDWGLQVAEALAHAHAVGVVHRDLKPANVMVTADGRIKVLDFGLAKHAGVPGDDPAGDTVTAELATDRHVVLGTAAYMSPEQAQGRPVDTRSDLFSFGTVLYEMLSGTRPFTGTSAVSVLGALVRETPAAPSSVCAEVPAELDRIVGKLLQKDPADRYQHADELLVDLRAARRCLAGDAASSSLSSAGPSLPAPRLRGRLAGAAAVVAAVALAGGAVAWALWPVASPARPEVMRFITPLPEGFNFQGAGFFASSLAITPDGSQVVVTAFDGNAQTTQLFRQRVGEFSVTPIDHTAGAVAPFISQDGEWVGFVDGTDVKRVRLAGGAAADEAGLAVGNETLLNVDVAFFGGDFDRDGDTIVIGECTRGLRAWSLSTRAKTRLSDLAPDALGVYQHQFPQVLPDDDHILLTAWRGPSAELHVRSRKTGEERKLLDNATSGRYVESGHIVYGWEGSLYAVRFDLPRVAVVGDPVKVLDGVVTESSRGAAHFAVSRTGTLAYIPGPFLWNSPRLGLVDRDGQVEDLGRRRTGQSVSFSADGRQLVTRFANGARGEVWAYDFTRALWRSVTWSESGDGLEQPWWPLVSPDGRSVAYAMVRQGDPAVLYTRALDSDAPPKVVVRSRDYVQPQSWTPDGRTLIYTQGGDQAKDYDIWTVDTRTGVQAPLVATAVGEIHPSLSPDGRWLAYASAHADGFRIVVRPFRDAGPIVQVSDDGHVEPRWSADGRTLFYRQADGRKIYAVSFEPGSPPRIGPASVAWQGEFTAASLYGQSWAPSVDGTRAAVWLRPERLIDANHYVVVLNWFEELKRLVPTP